MNEDEVDAKVRAPQAEGTAGARAQRQGRFEEH